MKVTKLPSTVVEVSSVSRRGFVKAASAVMVLAGVPAGAAEVAQALSESPAARTILSVGYWDGLIRGEAGEMPTSHIVAASSVRSDAAFSRGSALVTVRGFWRAPQNRFVRTSVSVIGLYSQQSGKTDPVVGWNGAMTKSGLIASRRSTLDIPTDPQNNVSLAIDRVTEGGRRRTVVQTAMGHTDFDRIKALAADSTSVMTLGSGASMGLRSGMYFVALRDNANQEAPSWSRLRALSTAYRQIQPDGASVLVMSDGSSEPSFDYIVMTIEPGAAKQS